MSETKINWLKGSFPQWLVVGLITICSWFMLQFIKDREDKLKFLIEQQILVSKAVNQLEFKVNLLEQSAIKVSEAQKQIGDNQAMGFRNMDRLTVIIEEIKKKL